MRHDFAAPAGTHAVAVADHDIERVYRKVVRRLLPVLFISYVLCTLDRLNIGYAHLQMRSDLGLSDAAYGLGAGLFFLTYMAFEVPGSMLLRRIGMRRTIFRIMFGWGLVSAATMFVKTPFQFYIARLLLGMCEAGFFPAIIYYFSLWLPSHRRARIIAGFMMAIVAAGVFGGPLSGIILDRMNGVLGLRAWQWLFLLEGLPSCAFAFVAYSRLSENPTTATFLEHDERQALVLALSRDRANTQPGHSAQSFAMLVRDWRVYAFALVFYCTTAAAYGLAFWGPAVVKSFGVRSALDIGLLIGGPSLLAGAAMWFNGVHSDRKMERRWHFAVPAVICAVSLAVLAMSDLSLTSSIVLFSLAVVGIQAAVPIFWSVPSSYLAAPVAATGIAFINTIAVFSGFVTPWLLGLLRERAGNFSSGLLVLAVFSLAAGVAMVLFAPRKLNK
ncbi:MFS transporter [Burkholderia cenocepacia]|uniref:MFS transporter n=1 Tax=Burkholderia cenocepacia TaxID=95486 RepID=UPI001CF1C035|nr:MFS transporter [Burkholderia cenocepacia]MCA7924540.1 MFS transporter [Burkholderia cenocepacia]